MNLWNKNNIPWDIKISFFSGPGAGGQKKNKTNCGVQLIESVTGITVRNEDTRSLQQNKKAAYSELAKRLSKHYSDLNREIMMEHYKKSDERIRTYNQNRGLCKDHRTNKSVPINKNTCTMEPKDLDEMINEINKMLSNVKD